MKRRSLAVVLLLLVFIGTAYSQGGGAGGGSGGGGGAGGGSLFGFKYILYPRFEDVKKGHGRVLWAKLRHFYHQVFLGTLNSRIRNEKNPDSLLRLVMYTRSQNVYGTYQHAMDSLNNKIGRQLHDNTDTVKRDLIIRSLESEKARLTAFLVDLLPKDVVFYSFPYGIDSVTYLKSAADTKPIRLSLTDFLLKEAKDTKTYHKKLKIYISSISKNTDSITFKIWHSVRIEDEKVSPFWFPNKDSAYRTDFSFAIPWNENSGTHRKFILPFRTKYLTAVNIPFLYDHNTDSFAVSFLNAGVAYGWAWGRTKFYEYNQMTPRNSYFGIGPLVNLSSTLTANNSSSLAKLVMGGHIGYTTGSIQFLGVMGWYGNFVPKHGFQMQCKPIYGFGIGLSLFNFSVPTASSQPTGH